MGWTVYNSSGQILQGSSTLADDSVTSAKIVDGTIVNADVNASAALAYSKLAALADGNILVGNGSNVATSVNPSGDVDISNTGAFSIASGVVVNADVNASAAIAFSKMENLTNSRLLVSDGNGDVSVSAVTAAEMLQLSGISANVTDTNLNALTGSGATALHSHAAGGSLDTALTSFVRDGDYRSVYMLGAWPQGFAGTTDENKCGFGNQFAVDNNGANSGIYSSTNGGGWNFTSGDSDQHSCALFAGEARLRASDDFTIVCRFSKESASLFSFGLAADVQGYRPEAQNDCIAFYFGANDEVQAITDNGGTSNEEGVINSGVSGEHDAKIVISSNGASVAFYVDGTLEATHTTNIPTATDLYLFMTVSSYTNGTYRRCTVMDFFAYREV